MGVNYYLKRKKPRLVYDEYHIAKCSWGWEPHFQSRAAWDEEDGPSYHSVADIKNLFDTGEYDIVDEYGRELSGWDEFEERVLRWGKGRSDLMRDSDSWGFRDPQGYSFTREDFC